jgi:hypothetical protein
MNDVQKAIFVGAREGSGVWEILNDITNSLDVSRQRAFCLIQNELNFLMARDDIFFIKSEHLYKSDSCSVLNMKTLTNLTLNDVEFKESGPFYYFSNIPAI